MSLSKSLIGVLRQMTQSSELLTPAGKEAAQRFFDQMEQTLSPGEYVRELTYAEAMKYFKTDVPRHQKATQGVIMRKATSRKIHVIQVFLDANDEVIPQVNNDKLPYGRQLFAERLDQELDEAFGSANVILVK